MYVARVLYPVEVLGPGKRIGIWFCGCQRRCKGCSNPELWEFDSRYKTTPKEIFKLVIKIANTNTVDGFTITGGDPMYQPDSLKELIALIKDISDDILVYTGYKIEELPPDTLQNISVLIDGDYIESRNTSAILRGSENQEIYILSDKYRTRYETYFKSAENQIQNFITTDGVISVGIHKPNFINELNTHITQKGLQRNNE